MTNPSLEGYRAYLCPKCPSKEALSVTDSRPASFLGSPSIRRRRWCATCDHKFTTYEVTEDLAENRLQRCEQLERATADFIKAVQEQK